MQKEKVGGLEMKEYNESFITKRDGFEIGVRTKSIESSIRFYVLMGVESCYVDLTVLTANTLIEGIENVLKGVQSRFVLEDEEMDISVALSDSGIVIGFDMGVDGLWGTLNSKEIKKLMKMFKTAINKMIK